MAKTNQQIIVTEGDFGVEILTQFIDTEKKPVPIEGCSCKIKFAYDGNVISEKIGVVIDEPKGIVSVILDKEETQYSGLWTSYWICYDQFNNVTTTENIYYYVQPAIGSVNNPAFVELLKYYNRDEIDNMFKNILEQLNNYTLAEDEVEEYIKKYIQDKVDDDFVRQCILDAVGNGNDYVKKEDFTVVFNNLHALNSQLDNIENKANLANSKFRLTTVSAYDDIDSYHPKILRFNPQWNGYYYWMAFTPYPNGNQAKENPHILASNNMLKWVEPKGYRNPLEPQPEGTPDKQYNSDTHLVFRKDLDRLECWWRYVNDDTGKVIIYRKHTTDGVNWSEKEEMINWVRKEHDCLSPALIWEDNMYKMWHVDVGYVVKYMESVDGKVWNNKRQLNITYDKPNMKNWHLDVIKTNKGYEMLLSSFENGQNRNDMDLYYTKSSDNVNWDTCITILKHSNDPLSWDNRGIYRSSFLIKDGLYYVFYSATSTKGTKGIGITYGKEITNLKGIENNDMYIFNNAKAFNMVFNAFLRNYALQLTAPRKDGTTWSGCLAHHNSTDMKLIEEIGSEVFKNLMLNALKTYEGVIFQGKSAYYKANEFKIYEPGKCAIMGIGETNYFKPIRNDATRKTGGFEVSAIKFEDIGIPNDMVKEGTVRYSSSRKQLLLYNGTEWVPLN